LRENAAAGAWRRKKGRRRELNRGGSERGREGGRGGLEARASCRYRHIGASMRVAKAAGHKRAWKEMMKREEKKKAENL